MASGQAFRNSAVEMKLNPGEGMLDVWIENIEGDQVSKEFDVIVELLR